jgi:hypothetical protein
VAIAIKAATAIVSVLVAVTAVAAGIAAVVFAVAAERMSTGSGVAYRAPNHLWE